MEFVDRVFFWLGAIMVVDGLVALLFRRRLGSALPGLDIPIVALVEIILGLGLVLVAG